MADPLDAAIAAAAAPKIEPRSSINVTIASTGRHVAIDFPLDLADGEVAEFMGWVGTQLLGACRAQRGRTAGGRIILPGH